MSRIGLVDLHFRLVDPIGPKFTVISRFSLRLVLRHLYSIDLEGCLPLLLVNLELESILFRFIARNKDSAGPAQVDRR